jgi:dTMP kinase
MSRFISFEGIEGVGKSTNIAWVQHCLEAKGQEVVSTREPGGTPIAEAIRQLLLQTYPEENMLPDTELLLLYAGRIQHVQSVILPALKAGKWVLCDRFYDASFAYQGGGRGLPLARIQALHDWALPDLRPDYTLLFDAPTAMSMQRLADKKKDRIENEKEAFFECVRQQYLSLARAEPKRFYMINATLSLDAIQKTLQDWIDQWTS